MPVCDDILLKTKVVVMENEPMVQQTFKEVMTDELNWEVESVNNQEDAVSLAKNKEAG
ncbi:MAG: hypothetical protein ACRDEA_22050 [Microcystaceae cyanobacterium]